MHYIFFMDDLLIRCLNTDMICFLFLVSFTHQIFKVLLAQPSFIVAFSFNFRYFQNYQCLGLLSFNIDLSFT